MLKNLCVSLFVLSLLTVGSVVLASHLPVETADVETLSHAYLPPPIDQPILALIDDSPQRPSELYESANNRELFNVLNIPKAIPTAAAMARATGIYDLGLDAARSNDFVASTTAGDHYVGGGQQQPTSNQDAAHNNQAQSNYHRNGNRKQAAGRLQQDYSYAAGTRSNAHENNIGRTGINTGKGYEY